MAKIGVLTQPPSLGNPHTAVSSLGPGGPGGFVMGISEGSLEEATIQLCRGTRGYWNTMEIGETLGLHRWQGEGHQFCLLELMNYSLKLAAWLKAEWISPTSCSERIPVPLCAPMGSLLPLPGTARLPARCCPEGGSAMLPSLAKGCRPSKVSSCEGSPCPHVPLPLWHGRLPTLQWTAEGHCPGKGCSHSWTEAPTLLKCCQCQL